jgi:hypothetical protein
MGIRAILLLAAVVLFLLEAFDVVNSSDVSLLAIGFACFAGAFLVTEMPNRRN